MPRGLLKIIIQASFGADSDWKESTVNKEETVSVTEQRKAVARNQEWPFSRANEETNEEIRLAFFRLLVYPGWRALLKQAWNNFCQQLKSLS